MNQLHKGYLAAILSSCSFGFIPLFSLPLLTHYSSTHILVYRTLFSCIGLAIVMPLMGISFKVKIKDLPFLLLGGCLYFFSAWLLLMSYKYVYSGMATTIHFSYPIFVSVILLLNFGIKPSKKTVIAIISATIGVGTISLLSGGDGGHLSLFGIIILILSGLAYASYIILLRYSRLSRFPGFRVTLYVMMVSCIIFMIISLSNKGYIERLQTPQDLTNVLLLAIVPTIISNLALIIAVQMIGSSKTAILGALEPLTALIIGICIFNEPLSIGGSVGVALILLSVYLVIKEKDAMTED